MARGRMALGGLGGLLGLLGALDDQVAVLVTLGSEENPLGWPQRLQSHPGRK